MCVSLFAVSYCHMNPQRLILAVGVSSGHALPTSSKHPSNPEEKDNLGSSVFTAEKGLACELSGL